MEDIILMSSGLNRVSGLFYSNPNRFQKILNNEKILRRIDSVFLIDSSGTIIMSEPDESDEEHKIPTEDDFNLNCVDINQDSNFNILDIVQLIAIIIN